MLRDFHPQLFFDGFLNFQQARIAEFENFFRLQINEMVVLAEFVGFLVLRAVVPKLMLDDQTAIEQQVDGVV